MNFVRNIISKVKIFKYFKYDPNDTFEVWQRGVICYLLTSIKKDDKYKIFLATRFECFFLFLLVAILQQNKEKKIYQVVNLMFSD